MGRPRKNGDEREFHIAQSALASFESQVRALKLQCERGPLAANKATPVLVTVSGNLADVRELRRKLMYAPRSSTEE